MSHKRCVDAKVQAFMAKLAVSTAGEHEFHQAVEEVVRSVYESGVYSKEFERASILERVAEPERVIMFRVPWVDDRGRICVNRGYRVEFNSAIGPYKGGLRFHPSVNLGILKFLGFEQIFKNSLTGLMMGGGKGGSDFDPKGKSDGEVMRFCQSFMSELYRHIGAHTDVPAGDIGVGGREIGYLFGQYKRLANKFTGVFTGKKYGWGGSLIRPEATGYGLVYFVQNMLKHESLSGMTVAVSGSGNVAQYAAEKAMQLGGKVVTLSDSDGTIYDAEGMDAEKLAYVMHLKNVERGRISAYAEKFGAKFFAGARPWRIGAYDIALPCATQNEVDREDARVLVENGVQVVAEGANMPSNPEAIAEFQKAKILYGLGKAANAGGVSVSGLEMAQDSAMLQWTREEVDAKLKTIMQDIHTDCVQYGQGDDGFVNYVKGANTAGFLKVANAMLDQGVI